MLTVVHPRGAVGMLRQEQDQLTFTYAESWLASSDAFPLSPRLALRAESWAGDEVACFFDNLLPEGPPRGNLHQLLQAFGRECAGAFNIVAEDEADSASSPGKYKEYSRAALTRDLQRLRENIPLLGNHAELRLSLAGAQNKIPVRYAQDRLWLPLKGAASTHILKCARQPARSFADSVANEALCLRLASELGLPVPNFIVMAEPEPLLLIERYDRLVDDQQVERLHQLNFCQLAGVLPANKHQADGGPSLETCFEIIDAYSTAPAVDRLQLVDWTLINYLIGNANADASNLSMLYGADGRCRLAPAYDLLATGYWEQLDDQMAMSIGGERRPAEVHTQHWQQFCHDVGLNPTQLRRRALDLCARALAKLHDTATSLAVPHTLHEHLAATLKTGSDRINHM